ncbi:hypothetical protein VPH35_053025 [Triticum aestivum]
MGPGTCARSAPTGWAQRWTARSSPPSTSAASRSTCTSARRAPRPASSASASSTAAQSASACSAPGRPGPPHVSTKQEHRVAESSSSQSWSGTDRPRVDRGDVEFSPGSSFHVDFARCGIA